MTTRTPAAGRWYPCCICGCPVGYNPLCCCTSQGHEHLLESEVMRDEEDNDWADNEGRDNEPNFYDPGDIDDARED
jgi:hypothetical protein